MQQIQLNIISFKPVVDNLTLTFYGKKQKGFATIYLDKLFESFPKVGEVKYKSYNIDIQSARSYNIEKCAEAKRVISYIFNEICKMFTLLSISCFWQSIIGSDIPVFEDTINKTDSVKLLDMDIKKSNRMSVIVKSIKMACNLHFLFKYSGLNEEKTMNFKHYYTPENISIMTTNKLLIKDGNVYREWIDLVNQVSYKDWQSISSQNLLVTTL